MLTNGRLRGGAGGSSVKSHLEGMAGKGIEQYAVVGASAHEYVSNVEEIQ